MNNSLVAFALFFSIFGILLTTSSSFVQTSDAAMYKVTSGGSLNIILQPTPFPVIKGSQTNLKVSFDQKGSSAVQAQVDYDLTIMRCILLKVSLLYLIPFNKKELTLLTLRYMDFSSIR